MMRFLFVSQGLRFGMYEKLYRMEGSKPAEELHKLLTEVRVRHERFKVTLGYPPFERDGREKITGIRLRFEPATKASAPLLDA